jgi:hypothetical protein
VPNLPLKKIKAAKLPAKSAPSPRKVAFPKKNHPPTAAAFAARLPLTLGKRFELVRNFLLKQKGIREEPYFYGPKTGWALRYLQLDKPVCSLVLHGDMPVGILSLEPAVREAIDWATLSAVAAKARKAAHGSPSLLWLDVPLAGMGATDLKAILRVKLALISPH